MAITDFIIAWIVGSLLMSIVVIFVGLFIPVARKFVLGNIKVVFILIFAATFILEIGVLLSGINIGLGGS